MQLEKETEIALCEPNYPLLEIFDECKRLGKRIIIVSDMYLDKKTIEEMLKKCGVKGYERLFLSSELGIKKKDRKLYEYVIEELGIAPSKILHLGDRFMTDYINPKIAGIRIIRIQPYINNLQFTKKSEYFDHKSDMLAFVNNQLMKYDNKSEIFRYGYESFGPLLMGFTQWVNEVIKAKEIEKVLFLARDMFLVKDIYKKMFPNEDIAYLEVSRRSLREQYILQTGTIDSLFDTITRKKYTIITYFLAM